MGRVRGDEAEQRELRVERKRACVSIKATSIGLPLAGSGLELINNEFFKLSVSEKLTLCLLLGGYANALEGDLGIEHSLLRVCLLL